MGKEKIAAAPFNPPLVRVGDSVLWHHGLSVRDEDGGKPYMALITEVGANGRHRLAVLAPDNTGFTVHDDPVPHRDDPMARRITESDPDAGVWEERPCCLNAIEIANLRRILSMYEAETREMSEQEEADRKAAHEARKKELLAAA